MSEPVIAVLFTLSFFAGLALWVPCLEYLSAREPSNRRHEVPADKVVANELRAVPAYKAKAS